MDCAGPIDLAQDPVKSDSYRAIMDSHEGLMGMVLAQAVRSPVYKGRLPKSTSLGSLSEVPLTSYDMMAGFFDSLGVDDVLLAAPVQTFRTSGSTGTPKSFYYGQNDIDRIAKEYLKVARIVGVRPEHRMWNLGGRLPDVSGYILEEVGRRIPLRGMISTFLMDDKDLIRALRRISSEERIDIMASGALVFYLLGRMSQDPQFLRGIVENKVRSSFHLPRPLAISIAKLYLHGVDMGKLREIAEHALIAFSYAEALHPYMKELRKAFPNLAIHDVYGSTENPLMAVQLDRTMDGLSMFLGSIIPEIADPQDVRRAKDDPSQRVKGVLWADWKAGMQGELIISRPGECLPLVRYPTGDVIEVVDPFHRIDFRADGKDGHMFLPLIRLLGRSVETLDFETKDESGNFLGIKVYSRHVNEMLHRSSNVRWWEIYNIRETPARLVVVVIPEARPADCKRFKAEVLRRLTEERADIPQSFQIAHDLGGLDIIVLPPEAYASIQVEIDRRLAEGRSMGQLKPKHIYLMQNRSEYEKVIKARYSKWL